MKCPKCGAEAYRVNTRPKPGMNPLLRAYQCRLFTHHFWWDARGRKPLAPKNKPHMPQMELPLDTPAPDNGTGKKGRRNE
jgi:hypothetical protein